MAIGPVVTRGYSIGTIALVTLRGYTSNTIKDLDKDVITSGVWSPTVRKASGEWTPTAKTSGSWTPARNG